MKRRRWRIKRACFEEGPQTADMKYPLFGLSRRCIPSWVISALRAALRRLRSETRLRAQSRAHPSLPSRRIYHFIDRLRKYVRFCRLHSLGRFPVCGQAGQVSCEFFYRCRPERFAVRDCLRASVRAPSSASGPSSWAPRGNWESCCKSSV